jgi:hypothetical protein
VPLKVTAEARVRLVPVIVTALPTGPLAGLKPLIVGDLVRAADATGAAERPCTIARAAISITGKMRADRGRREPRRDDAVSVAVSACPTLNSRSADLEPWFVLPCSTHPFRKERVCFPFVPIGFHYRALGARRSPAVQQSRSRVRCRQKGAYRSTSTRRGGRWLCALHTESLAGDPFARDRSSSA